MEWRAIWQSWEWAGNWVFPSHKTCEQLTVSGVNKDHLMNGGDLASLADLMGHESVETTKSFYAVFEQEDLRRKHDHFSAARWDTKKRSWAQNDRSPGLCFMIHGPIEDGPNHQCQKPKE